MADDDASRRPSQAYATVSPVGVGTTMTFQKEKTVVSLLNEPLSKLNCLKFKPPTQGFLVCLLPQTVVVLSENAESFQVLQRLVQWSGFTTDGSRYDCGSHFGKQYVGSVFDRGGDRGQRMERFKKNTVSKWT